MTPNRWMVNALAALAAIAVAYYGAVVTWGVVGLGMMMIDEGAGGLGAVSAGFTDTILVSVFGCLVTNRLLAGFARRSGGLVRRLHRAHSFTFAAANVCVVLPVLILTISLLPPRLFTLILLIAGILLAAQFWLLCGLLIAFIRRPAASMMA
jgi:hypothetical protein